MVEGTIIKDYRTEYAKSGAAKCRTCEEKISKVGLKEQLNVSFPVKLSRMK